jgi:cyclopropane fatty-acyl-phospholipid synthase-like methyltransferase
VAQRQNKQQQKIHENHDDDDDDDDATIQILDIGTGTGLLAMMGVKHTLNAINFAASPVRTHWPNHSFEAAKSIASVC